MTGRYGLPAAITNQKKVIQHMKRFLGIVVRALLLLIVWSCVGLGLNLVSSKPLPWVYVPPQEVELAGVKVPLIDEKEALKYLGDPSTVFVDTRKPEHYAERHVKGAVSLPFLAMEERYPLVQPMLPEENRFIVYCYGPECEEAERVSEFLAQLGYKRLFIMSAGFPGWDKAKYPVEGKGPKDGSGGEK
jgi:rhodanese-related sulfurtransferase